MAKTTEDYIREEITQAILADRKELLEQLIAWCEKGIANYGERSYVIKHLRTLMKPDN